MLKENRKDSWLHPHPRLGAPSIIDAARRQQSHDPTGQFCAALQNVTQLTAHAGPGQRKHNRYWTKPRGTICRSQEGGSDMGRLQFSSPSFSSSATAILQTIAGVIAEPSTYSCGTVPLYLLLLLLTRLAITKAGRSALSAVIFELKHGLLPSMAGLRYTCEMYCCHSGTLSRGLTLC